MRSSTLGISGASRSRAQVQQECNAPSKCFTVSNEGPSGYDPVREAMNISAQTELRQREKDLKIKRFMQATQRKVSQRALSSRDAPQQAPSKTRVHSNFEAAVIEIEKRSNYAWSRLQRL